MKRKHFWFSVNCEYLEQQGVNIYDVFNRYKTIKFWACIKHDKDIYNEQDELDNPEHRAGTHKKDHYHVYLNFGKQNIDSEMVAKWFSINEHSVKIIETTKEACLLYFVHGNEESIKKGKYIYDWSEVRHSSNWNPQVVAEQEQYIGHFERFSYEEQIEKINQIQDTATKVRLKKLLDDSFNLDNDVQNLQRDRFLQVIFITGDSGSGKTTFAKQFLEKMNYFDVVPKEYWKYKPFDSNNPLRRVDYGISSAKDTDVFGMYKGQTAYILDDLRDTTFKFDVLLKILDNHTNSPVPARFKDKVLKCNILVITSFKPLSTWYKKDDDVDGESLIQLYRRIGTYIEVDDKEITIYNELNNKGEPVGEFSVIPNRTSEYYGDKPQGINMRKYIFNMFDGENYQSTIDKKMTNPQVTIDDIF